MPNQQKIDVMFGGLFQEAIHERAGQDRARSPHGFGDTGKVPLHIGLEFRRDAVAIYAFGRIIGAGHDVDETDLFGRSEAGHGGGVFDQTRVGVRPGQADHQFSKAMHSCALVNSES
jgi:hypothetical protein